MFGLRHGWLAGQMYETAYNRAIICDAERDQAKAEDRPLPPVHGIPFSVKDHVKVKGVASHWGYLNKLFEPAEEDNLAVKLLVADGAIPFVKSAVPSIPALVCRNVFSGFAENPHNFKRSTGGSSAGEGGLVAAGCSPFGIGSDQSGSLRVPAAFCKLATLSPGRGRIADGVANQGLLTKDFLLAEFPQVVTLGPMAKCVEDCAAVMESWCRPGRYEQIPGMMRLPVTQSEVETLKGRKWRFAYFLTTGLVKPCPAVVNAVLSAKRILEAHGHTFVELEIPRIEEYAAAIAKAIFCD